MLESLFSFLGAFEDFLWGYLGAPAIILLGILLSIQSRCFQIRKFPAVVYQFFRYFSFHKTEGSTGVHPLKVFFACIGGCVGIGNIVGVCTAIQVGGPGALLWIWITAIVGGIVKYAEVCLGVRHRIVNEEGGYSGGPMYYLQHIKSVKWLPAVVCVLLCIYGVEVYQFSVITESLSSNLHVNKLAIAVGLLAIVLFVGNGGVQRVGNISSAIIPVFFVLYTGMGTWVIIQHYASIPSLLKEVLISAFQGKSAVGGFLGSTIILTMSQGVRRGCYSSDIGVGYASTIHSESAEKSASIQASLVFFDIFLDTFVFCTMSVMLILLSGIWQEPMEAGMLVQSVLIQHFPFMNVFMPLFLTILGYSTLNAYFCVGVKCAEYLSKKRGRVCFNLYAATALLLSVFVDTTQAQTIMQIAGGLLLMINCWGIYRLRQDVSYAFGASHQLVQEQAY
ncbi:MAG: amino acid carrier protein [Waddliaceae bacterium]